MSATVLDKVRCSACGETFECELYQSVTANEDPVLKEAILAGELNLVKCSFCFQMIYAERFVLYHDASRELMAFVYPKDMEHKREEIQATVASAFLQIQTEIAKERPIPYQPFLLFGMDLLCDLLHDEEDIQDEATVVDFLCHDMRLEKKKINHDMARRMGLPLVLPLAAERPGKKSSVTRESVIEGLRQVLQNNPNLARYKAFLERIEADPAWNLEQGA